MSARLTYSNAMAQLDPLLEEEPVKQFVDDAPFHSSLETVYWLFRIRHDEALPAEVSPLYVGFTKHPVVSDVTREVVGHIPVPALVTARWTAILQVSVLTPTFYTMDAIVCTFENGVRKIYGLEIDGPSHLERDVKREKAIGLKVLRFTRAEVLAGVGIDEKLDEMERKTA